VLTNVSIDKASELEAFVTIPLKIAQAVVELPAQIVQFRLVDIKGEGDLLTAQGNLINALKSYQDIVSPPAAQTVGSGADQLLAACLQTNADVGACRSAVLPRARVLR